MNWQGTKPCSRRIGSGCPGPVRFAFLGLLSVARRQAIGAVAVLAADGPEAVQHAVFADLVDDQPGLAVDHVGRRDVVVPAHAEAAIGRAADLPLDCERGVGNDLDGRGTRS